MAATKNNEFWKFRSKHGRDTLFSSPDLLWSAACEYFEWCDYNPWYKKEVIKSGKKTGKCIDVPIQRPYTLIGLCCFVGCSEAYFRQFNTDKHEGFSTVISQIKQIIEVQQREGAIVGTFNANIISRMLGEIEKLDVVTGGEKLQFTGFNFLPYTPEADLLRDKMNT